MTEIGVTLRAAREAAGVSLSVMAKRTQYGKGYLGNVRQGFVGPLRKSSWRTSEH